MKSHFRWVAATIVASVLGLAGCTPKPEDTQINTRIKSPDGKLEAIYAEDIGGGPAVGVTEEVFVVERGAFPHLNERIFSEECAHNIVLTWENPKTVKIIYDISSGIREAPEVAKPSLFSILSSGYWTYSHPHGTQVRLAPVHTPAADGC